MIKFHFKANNSFIRYKTHPITVPRSQVSYDHLEQQELNNTKMSLIFPNGERAQAHLYHGKSGYGRYCQIRVHSRQLFPPYLSKGDNLLILLVKDGYSQYVVIEYRKL